MAPKIVHQAWNVSNNYLVAVEAGAVLCVLLAQVNYNFFQTAPSTSANCSIYYPRDRKEAHLSFTLHFFQSLKIENPALTDYK